MRVREAERALAAANPVRVCDARALNLGAGEEELVNAILGEPRPRPVPARRPRPAARPLLVAAAVALLALTAVVVGLPGGKDEARQGGIVVLDRVAAAAAAQPDPAPALQYGYLKTQGSYVDTTAAGGSPGRPTAPRSPRPGPRPTAPAAAAPSRSSPASSRPPTAQPGSGPAGSRFWPTAGGGTSAPNRFRPAPSPAAGTWAPTSPTFPPTRRSCPGGWSTAAPIRHPPTGSRRRSGR